MIALVDGRYHRQRLPELPPRNKPAKLLAVGDGADDAEQTVFRWDFAAETGTVVVGQWHFS